MFNPTETDLAALTRTYDVFLIDQFGVLRDDIGPYEGAVKALSWLASQGKRAIVLSNSGRSGDYNSERLVRLGFAAESFERFVTSGDVAFDLLSKEGSGVAKSARCFTVSSGGDTDLADRLGLASTGAARGADIVIISGSEAERISMDEYRKMLLPAAVNGIPCFCTNPDIHKLHEGRIAPGAGSIAKLYEELGGSVRWVGKPFPEIYEYALKVAAIDEQNRVVCIGDSIEHDILGANIAGLGSVLVRTGILAGQSEDELARIAERSSAYPDFLLARFSL